MFDKSVCWMAWCFTVSMCIHRISIAVSNLLLVVGVLLFVYVFYKERNAKIAFISNNYIDTYKYFVFMIMAILPSVIFSLDPKESIKAFINIWIYKAITFIVIPFLIKDKRLLEKMLMVFIAVEAVDGLVAMIQVLTGITTRGYGFGHHVMFLAGLLAMVIPVVCIAALDSKINVKLRKVCVFALPCLIAGAIAGQSRGLWLTLVCVLPLVLFNTIIKNKKYIAIFLILILTVGGVFVSSPKLMHRVKSITNMTTDRSNGDRLVVWQSSINMIKDYPVTGIGLGNFKDVYEPNYRLNEMTQNLPHAHNNFLQVAVETGVVGFIGFFVFTCYMLWSNFFIWIKTKNPYALMLFGLWAGFTAFGMIDSTILGSSNVKTLWYLSGVLLVLKTLYTDDI